MYLMLLMPEFLRRITPNQSGYQSPQEIHIIFTIHFLNIFSQNDTSPNRRSARKVHIVTPPDIDDSRPLDSLDLRTMTPPNGNDIRQQKTPPPLSLSDEEFRQKFMLAI